MATPVSSEAAATVQIEGAERRRHDREGLRLKVEYTDVRGMIADYTENISRGGTFILTDREYGVGTHLKISLSFPGLLEPISLGAVVRWTRGGPERGIGVEFELEDAKVHDRLEMMMDRIQKADPKLVARVLRVLLVEDNPHVVELLKDGIGWTAAKQSHGRLRFDFVHVRHGMEALDLLETEKFDLIITDIYMPVMDGAAFIKTVRSDSRTNRIPIIAISGGGTGAGETAELAGASVFLEKPMRLHDVLSTVRRLVQV